MSAATLSITSNTAAARRRTVVTGDRKKAADLVNDANVAAGDDKEAGSGALSRDLSHSIRGDVVLERSKDMLPLNKSQLPNSTVSPRRPRKLAVPKPEKPRWQTVLSVITKNFILLLVIVGLVHMVRRMVIGSTSDLSGNLMGFSDMEGRIADAESYVKKTTKMMQLQVETVDKKIASEVRSLRAEVNKKLEEKGKEFTDGLATLDEKNKVLENALSQLTNKDLLSKEGFAEFYDEFSKSRGGNLGQSDLSLDEIRAIARQIVEKEIDRHAADGLGKVDYALATGGGAVVKHSEPFATSKGSKFFSIPNRNDVHSDAEKMLKPSFGEPGQCFPLKGSNGFVEIRLRTAIIPEAVTLEHVSKSVAYDRSSAPKDCRVSGWLQGGWQGGAQQGLETESGIEGEKMFLLTEFSYDLEKSNAQTYNVFESAGSSVVDTVRFEFASNHGSPSHTCIYRLRVHGREPNSMSVLA